MPQTDPLQNIMGMLRNSNAIDPNQAQQRMAQMKPVRQQLGATPPVQTKMPQPGAQQAKGARPVIDRGGPEEGTDTGMTAPDSTIPIIIDALNESIIALKVEIHRAADPKQRKELEQHAKRLRQEILSLGGEPIYADESVEEGLAKLTGQGYIASPTVRDFGSQLGVDVGWDPNASMVTVGEHSFAKGEIPHTRFDQSTGQHYITDQQAFQRQFAPTQYTPEGGFQQPDDQLSQILQGLGQERVAAPAPQLTVTPEYINQLLDQYGLHPRSEEDIQAEAAALAERQALQMRQIVQRELDRFSREHPPEYAKAEERIRNAAQAMGAEAQEEFANRGMYYTSIMGSAMGELNSQALTAITEIANAAASRVVDLRGELKDIAQWQVLEEEVLRYQLSAEDRQLSERLVNLHTQVAMHADQMAMDHWYREEMLNIEHRNQQLSELQMRIQEAERAGQHLAAAYMADNPIIRDVLQNMGIGAEQFQNMPMEQRSAMVYNAMNYAEFQSNIDFQNVQSEAITHQMGMDEKRFGLAERQFEEGITQFWAQFGLAQKEFEHAVSIDNQRIALENQRISQGWASLELQRESQRMNMAIAQYEKEIYAQQKGRESAEHAYNIYSWGHESLMGGNTGQTEATLQLLRELGYTEWARRLSGDYFDYRKALQEDPNANNFLSREVAPFVTTVSEGMAKDIGSVASWLQQRVGGSSLDRWMQEYAPNF